MRCSKDAAKDARIWIPDHRADFFQREVGARQQFDSLANAFTPQESSGRDAADALIKRRELRAAEIGCICEVGD
jgi:hypothetical protein